MSPSPSRRITGTRGCSARMDGLRADCRFGLGRFRGAVSDEGLFGLSLTREQRWQFLGSCTAWSGRVAIGIGNYAQGESD